MLPTELLREAMEKRKLELLRTTITTAAEIGDEDQQVDPLLLTEARSFLAVESLRAAIKWYPLRELRLAIAAAEASEHEVDGEVLDEARSKVVLLATRALNESMRTRRLQPLRAAVATAEGEGLVDEAVMDQARELVAVLEVEPAGAELAPAGAYAVNELTKPGHIDVAMFEPIMHCGGKSTLAVNDYKYWGGGCVREPTALPCCVQRCCDLAVS